MRSSRFALTSLTHYFVACCVMVALILATPIPALAHSEVIEASPGRSSTVGGTIDRIEVQFVGLAEPGNHTITVRTPDGEWVTATGDLEQDFQRLILPIEDLSVPGTHTVTAVVDGIDDDRSYVTYTFEYDPSAPEPEGISIEQEKPGTDWVTYGLMGVTALAVVGLAWHIRRRLQITAPDAQAPDGTARGDEQEIVVEPTDAEPNTPASGSSRD